MCSGHAHTLQPLPEHFFQVSSFIFLSVGVVMAIINSQSRVPEQRRYFGGKTAFLSSRSNRRRVTSSAAAIFTASLASRIS